MRQFLIAIDQIFNTLIGSGWADETYSSFAYRMKDNRMIWIDKLFKFFGYTNHCQVSYENERNRMQLPPEMRP